MKRHESLLLKYLRTTYPNYAVTIKIPSWIMSEYWRPTYLLSAKRGRGLIAVDILLSGEIPKYQYKRIVSRLVREHTHLRVVLVTLEQTCENRPEIKDFCQRYGYGLKVIVPGIGVQTIVGIDLDPQVIEARLAPEEGWFPTCILEQAGGLERLFFADVINEFVQDARKLGNNQQKTLELVFKAISRLVRKHSSFSQNLEQFIRLARFEEMLRSIPPERSEHVFHSFRVFLAGCPVVEQFYDKFHDAHKRFCIGDQRDISVEYAWLLTAIFHDIGRAKEATKQTIQSLQEEFEDEDVELTMEASDKFWTRPHNITARRILGSLAAFVGSAQRSDRWDAGTLEGEESEGITGDWILMYKDLNRHGIIGAFEFLGRIVRNAAAANEMRHRPFILTHAAPAALAILLHDWRTWPKARDWNLYPVNASTMPMAALLIYIDTWDDYKRKGAEAKVRIKDYKVDKRGAQVVVEWGDSTEWEKQNMKYDAYKKALIEQPFSLIIKAGMAGGL